MVISVRHPRVNRWMRGLDKAYIVHKWTGIVSTILIVFHWLGENVPKWLVELGLVPDPGELTDGSGFSELEIGLFQSGVFLVEWVFYVLIVLVIIVLFVGAKKLPELARGIGQSAKELKKGFSGDDNDNASKNATKKS